MIGLVSILFPVVSSLFPVPVSKPEVVVATADQFISFKACLNSASSEAVGSMTSITEAVPLLPDAESNPGLFDLLTTLAAPPLVFEPGDEPILV